MKYLLLLIATVLLNQKIVSQTCTRPALDFGNNEWLVRVFERKNLADYNASQYTASNNYKGYYRQKIDVNNNYGFTTTLQWQPEGHPGAATAFGTVGTNNYGSAYLGCATTTRNILYTHKRKGFPPNQYEIYVDIWDDRTSIYLGGREINALAQYGSQSFAKYCVYLDETSELEVRTDNSGGGISQVSIRIVPATMTFAFSPNVELCMGTPLVLSATATASNSDNITNLYTNTNWTYTPNPPANIISSGATTTQATINTNIPGNYNVTFTGKFQECNITRTINVIVNQPLGDTAIFGNNTWNVYGFSNNNNLPNTDINYLRNNLKYFGYYTQTIATASNYGYNTTELSTGGWDRSNRPSNSSTWQGCTIPTNDNFTFIHKRQGFPCATYTLTLSNRGLNTKVYVNGTLVNVNSDKCLGNTGCTVNLGTFNLDANSKIEVRTNESTGAVLSILNIIPTITTNLAIDNDTKTCPVKGNQWVDFYQQDGRYLGSVRGTSPSSNLGNVKMTTFVESINQLVPACSNADNLTAVMQRHWLINASINGEGEVRLPYKDSEFTNLANASSLSTNPFDQVSHPDQSTIKLSRYSGPLNVNASPFDNCASGGTILHEQSGNIFRVAPYHYQDFVVPGFSEFWLHGSSNLTPLPTELENYSIECENYGTVVSWTANIPLSIQKVNLERSIDGSEWETIFTFNNTQTNYFSKEFKHIDVTKRNHYYRMVTTDSYYDQKVHKIMVSTCGTSTPNPTIMAYPNPANNQFTIQINSEETGSRAELIITDLYGKIVLNHPINTLKENQAILFDSVDLSKGTYIINLKGTKSTIQPVKLIIQ